GVAGQVLDGRGRVVVIILAFACFRGGLRLGLQGPPGLLDSLQLLTSTLDEGARPEFEPAV
uniref:hypothetical protein n=1 Tax=Myxococcus vastator TaxID=2709664 RepID=UPI00196791C8